MPFSHDDLDTIFTYHAPSPDQQVAYEKLRGAAKIFATALIELTPPCPDQSAAVRLLRSCVTTANAAIALKGRY